MIKWLKKCIDVVSQAQRWHPVLWYIVHLSVVWLIIIGYEILARNFLQAVDIEWTHRGHYFEIPILLLLGHLMYFGRATNKVLSCLLSASSILLLYIGFDVFYSYLNRSPRLSDLENITDIYSFGPRAFVTGCLALSVALLLLVSVLWKMKQHYKKPRYAVTLFTRLGLLTGLIIFLSSDVFSSYHRNVFEDIVWTDTKSIERNGRLSSFVYYSNQERKNRKKLNARAASEIDISEVLFAGEISHKRNIYFIVLESFVNPQFIRNASYSKDPLSPRLSKHLKGGKFSLLVSPVYGGGTAQAEFELLTGVQALRKINAVEFNMLKGDKMNGFLNLLRDAGYQTTAVIASDSSFFNSRLAYKSLGFNSVSYLDEVDDFKRNPADDEIFDGDVFEYSLKQVRNHLRDSKHPQFHYILGLYGHIPYQRNMHDRPNVLAVKGVDAASVLRVANQFYYRTEALGSYIDELLKEDPTALIFVTSDHLPSLFNAKVHYQYDRKINIAMMLDAGKPVEFNQLAQYEIPWLIWDRLTKKKLKRDVDTKMQEDLYYQILREGIGK